LAFCLNRGKECSKGRARTSLVPRHLYVAVCACFADGSCSQARHMSRSTCLPPHTKTPVTLTELLAQTAALTRFPSTSVHNAGTVTQAFFSDHCQPRHDLPGGGPSAFRTRDAPAAERHGEIQHASLSDLMVGPMVIWLTEKVVPEESPPIANGFKHRTWVPRRCTHHHGVRSNCSRRTGKVMLPPESTSMSICPARPRVSSVWKVGVWTADSSSSSASRAAALRQSFRPVYSHLPMPQYAHLLHSSLHTT
jgi:hypothetical protein